jgi:hypothetical protein
MLKVFGVAAVLAAGLAMPACAEEVGNAAPELVLPAPASAPDNLPQSSVTDVEPLAQPASEAEAAAPHKGCGSAKKTVYLTN